MSPASTSSTSSSAAGDSRLDSQPPGRVSWFVLLQATIQAWLRPAIWFPFLNRVHSYREVWRIDRKSGSYEDTVDSMVKAVDRLNRERRFGCDWLIGSTNRKAGRLTVLNLTGHCRWLDMMEIDLARGSVTSFSTGLVPLLLPMAPVANLAVFWFPFSDLLTNSKRVAALRTAMDQPVKDWSVGSVDTFQMLFY